MPVKIRRLIQLLVTIPKVRRTTSLDKVWSDVDLAACMMSGTGRVFAEHSRHSEAGAPEYGAQDHATVILTSLPDYNPKILSPPRGQDALCVAIKKIGPGPCFLWPLFLAGNARLRTRQPSTAGAEPRAPRVDVPARNGQPRLVSYSRKKRGQNRLQGSFSRIKAQLSH